MITPKEVRTCEFNMHRLFEEGYDTDEVDDMLDECANTIETLTNALWEARQKVDNLSQEIENLKATRSKRNVYSKHRSRRRK